MHSHDDRGQAAAEPAIRLGIVVPLANEERTIDEFLRRVLTQLGEHDRIYCVFDHASTDSTRQRVELACLVDRRIVPVWAPENRCVVDAYFRGYREALDANCTWILEMDGGLSHLPEEIPRFLEAMQAGVDFAAGSRFMAGGEYRGRISRRLLSWGGSLLARLVLGARMRDMTSGFECFTHRCLSHVVAQSVESRAHFFQTEIRWMLHGWQWKEIPITYTAPSQSVSAPILFEALRNLRRLRKREFADRPGNELSPIA